VFLSITPGFGVQYLSWLSYFIIIVSWRFGLAYSTLGGLFLYRVYTFWSGGFPIYNANSDQVGQWIGFEKMLDLAVWGVVISALIHFFAQNLIRQKLPAARTPSRKRFGLASKNFIPFCLNKIAGLRPDLSGLLQTIAIHEILRTSLTRRTDLSTVLVAVRSAAGTFSPAGAAVWAYKLAKGQFSASCS